MTQEGDTAPSSQSSEVRFASIVEQSPLSTQIFDVTGQTVAVNPAFEKLWGVTFEQIKEYNVLQDQQLVERGVMPMIQQAFTGIPTEIPAIRYVPEETVPGLSDVPFVWVSGSMYPLKDERGTVREVVLVHEDITERRLAEEALRESEERFRAIFSSAPIGISLIDKDGRYVAVNPSRQEMLGYTEAELVGRHYQEMTHPDDVAYDREVNAEAKERGLDTYGMEKRFLRRNGQVLWTRMTISVIRDPEGNVRYYVSTSEDVTARKQAEEDRTRLLALEREAREAAERLAAEQAALLTQIDEGIVMTDPTGQVTFMNAAALRLHGLRALPPFGDAPGYELFTLDGRSMPVEERPLVRAATTGERVPESTWRIVRSDGSEIVAQGQASPVVAEDGDRLGAVLAVRDITEQYDLERQKDDFLSALAHDLRTPLTSVKGRVQLLRRRLNRGGTMDPERLASDLERIEGSATRMMTLISELLDVANIQIGRPLKLDPHPIDLVALAQTAAADHRHGSDQHRIVVTAAVPELVGHWDITRLERVLANLISNALKYSPGGGEIDIRIDREEDRAVLIVCDQGIGIPADDLPTVFERFHRGRNVTGKIPGTGIGLAAVQEIVSQHGGSIEVESEEGAGTTFTVRLPIAP